MIKIQNILCPTDFSDFSTRAFSYAAAIAGWYEAKLEVVHVGPPLFMHAQDFPYMQPSFEADALVREAATQELQRFIETVENGMEIRATLREGDAVDEILKRAEEWPAGLIVMGTHGRSGFRRLVLGSVTEKLLRRAPCPVLTVPPAISETADPDKLKTILCPLDFSSSSVKSLEYALSLAQENDSRLILLHVIESLAHEEAPENIHFNVPEYRNHLVKEAKKVLKLAVPEAARSWCQPEELVVTGKAYREILRVAEENSVQLILMGVQGRSPFDLMMFGSTTQHVVRAAHCPVMSIREK